MKVKITEHLGFLAIEALEPDTAHPDWAPKQFVRRAGTAVAIYTGPIPNALRSAQPDTDKGTAKLSDEALAKKRAENRVEKEKLLALLVSAEAPEGKKTT